MKKIKVLLAVIIMANLLISCGSTNIDKPSILIETPKTYGDVLNGFKVMDLGAKTVSDSIIKEKKYSLVVLWSTDCKDCEYTLKVINELNHKYKDKGIGFLGILTDSVGETGGVDKKVVNIGKQKIKVWDIGYPNITVPVGIKEAVMPDIFHYPASFLVDNNGNIVSEFYPGNFSYEEWDKLLSELID